MRVLGGVTKQSSTILFRTQSFTPLYIMYTIKDSYATYYNM